MRPSIRLAVWLCLMGLPGLLQAQGNKSNPNLYYRFPFSLGVEYQTLTPLSGYNSDYTIYEISLDLRYPLPRIPVLQCFLHGGLMRFDSLDSSDPDKWDHSHAFAVLGMGYSNRFVKNFEIGGDLSAGFSEAVFPNLVDEPVGSANLLFSAGGKISLDPSYGLSIDIRPSLKYLLSLSPLRDFNGFLFGLGFTLNYRFGQDPDSAQAIIRSLRFSDLSIPPVFSAMQSYYVKNPLGEVLAANTEKQPITDVQFSFLQADYMDSATVCSEYPELKPGQSVKVPLLASFNQAVFTTEGVTPLTGEIVATYKLNGRAAEQRYPVSYDLYDKKAITWDDDRKVGAFITPADSALRNYGSYVRQLFKDSLLANYSEPIQAAMQFYSALAELGLLYQSDPTSPFAAMQGDKAAIDAVSLPRDTLKTITGDCDDLTVLYCSMLESVGIETGFITVPGHIYPAFNTKVPAAKYREIHKDRSMTVNLDGELWVPVEVTMLGRADFVEAWMKGVELWQQFEQGNKRRFHLTRQAQEIYRPVGLRESDLGLQYGNPKNIIAGFGGSVDKLAGIMVKEIAAEAKKSGNKADFNRLGLTFARFGKLEDAESAFNKALQIDPAYGTARINLANIAFLRGNYALALRQYQTINESLAKRGSQNPALAQLVLINISRTFQALNNHEEARNFFAKASALDPEKAKQYAYLAQLDGGSERAANVGAGANRALFAEEDAE
jgi:tetratricopeptide (TPR) repeat protein